MPNNMKYHNTHHICMAIQSSGAWSSLDYGTRKLTLDIEGQANNNYWGVSEKQHKAILSIMNRVEVMEETIGGN